MAKYKQSPVGTARHVWVNRPDTKFNADGLFHVDVGYEGEVAEGFRKSIDEATEEALAAHTKEMKPAEAKKWSAHYPYEIEEDGETGKVTGRIWFKYKQNAIIQLKDGTTKPVVIGIRDSKNKVVSTGVYSGDKIKVLYAERVTVATSNKTVGLRLDFAAVMLVAKAERDGGFTEEEGGFVENDRPAPGDAGGPTPGEDAADY